MQKSNVPRASRSDGYCWRCQQYFPLKNQDELDFWLEHLKSCAAENPTTQTPQDSDEKSKNQACSSSDLPAEGGVLESPRKSMGNINRKQDDEPSQDPPEEPSAISSKNSDTEPSEKVKLI